MKCRNLGKMDSANETKRTGCNTRHAKKLPEEPLALDSISGPISIQDLDYNILFVSGAAAESIKEAPENLIGRKCYEIWYRRKNLCGNCPVPEALRLEKPQKGEISTPDGRICLVTAYPIRNKDGRIASIVEITSVHITKQKKAQEALRKSEEKHREILENLLQGIVIVQDFKIVYANKAFAETSGYTVEKLLALSPEKVRNLIYPEDQALVQERFRDLIQGRSLPSHYEYRGINKDGDVRWLEMTASAIDYGGKPAIQAAILDINEKKKAEERIRRSEQKYRNLFEKSPDGIVFVNTEGIITSCNVATETLTGFSRDEIIGKHFSEVEFIRSKDVSKYTEIFNSLIESKTPEPFEAVWYNRDGSCFLAEVRVSILQENGKINGFQATGRDITRLKSAEKKLREYSQKLEKRVEERTKELQEAQGELLRREKLAVLGQLVGSVGHELRDPLSIIRNSSYYLKQKLKDSNKDLEKHLSIIERNVERANSIISDLLDPFKARKLQLCETDVNSLIRETLADFEMPENISVRMSLDRVTPRTYLDQKLIRRAFRNISRNAVQAMPNGGVLEVHCRIKGDLVLVQFRDNGEGIPQDDVKRVFEPLFTTRPEGIGLGLTIVKNIIERHNGIIQIESLKGEGTTIALKLPILTKGAVDSL